MEADLTQFRALAETAVQGNWGSEATQAQSLERIEFFGELYCAFWEPLYAWLRHRRFSHHDAEDLLQDFFVRLVVRQETEMPLCQNGRCSACVERRCTSFLLVALRNCVCNHLHRKAASRRGGGCVFVEFSKNATKCLCEWSGSRSPRKILEAEWAAAVLERAWARLKAEVTDPSRIDLLESLESLLMGERPTCSYVELAKKWGMRASTLRMTVSRLRHRLAEFVLAEVAQEAEDVGSAEDALRNLHSCLSPV